ncbi:MULTISPECIES: DUF4393 domain-containing protein [unclassified Pseudomonas]|uniref:DUF4393 domain-containing protein n=1 Tax=unclassified Pseudomonas TaxID=196821 RepID=UPI000F58CE9F|nr:MULTISPECIES: DUF4393 domain-containing protein [unclassified Pseudomonas]AZF48249.1 hypothetical protein C4J86_3016 [Pseudomonas sp. R2-7-07]AZF58757.1 hypothetical protein C4J84_2882 [Pseudomonas sp. R11-23-07]
MSDSNNTKDVIDAVAGLTKEIPIYQDFLQPAVQELGKGLHTLSKTVSLALLPVSALVWGVDEIKDFVVTKVTQKLRNVPEEDVIAPRPNVGGPILEALRYTGHEDELSDMYANLLASAMDVSTANHSHPSFVESIKQMTSDEAKIMKLFLKRDAFPTLTIRAEFKESNSGYDHTLLVSDLGSLAICESPAMTPYFLDNLRRLGLVELLREHGLHDAAGYEVLEESNGVVQAISEISYEEEMKARIIRGAVKVSPLGRLFLQVCVVSKE